MRSGGGGAWDVVGEHREPPLGPDERSAAVVEAIDLAVVLGVTEHGSIDCCRLQYSCVPTSLASTRRMNAYRPPVQPGRSPCRLPPSGGISTSHPCSATTWSMCCSFQDWASATTAVGLSVTPTCRVRPSRSRASVVAVTSRSGSPRPPDPANGRVRRARRHGARGHQAVV